jgi:phytanoyl-CoA hydroxylase
MKIIYEPSIPQHDPALYNPDTIADAKDYVDGWEGVTKVAISHYHERGFLVVRNGWSDETITKAREELRAMTLSENPDCGCVAFEGTLQERLHLAISSQATPDSGQFSLGTEGETMPPLPAEERALFVRKFMDFTRNHPPLAFLANCPALIQVIENLMESSPVLFQEMAMLKPPQGREKPWHQDHAYFNFALDTRIVGVWIALGDVRPENGCMFVLAGGHKAGARLHFLRRDWQICDTETLPETRTAVPMQAGDVLFFDGKIPHGTPINQTNETRWALQFHYLPTQAQSVEDTVRLEAFGAEGKDVTC